MLNPCLTRPSSDLRSEFAFLLLCCRRGFLRLGRDVLLLVLWLMMLLLVLWLVSWLVL